MRPDLFDPGLLAELRRMVREQALLSTTHYLNEHWLILRMKRGSRR